VIVLIAGMPRSGSTFSFNVARQILAARGSVYQETCEDVVGVVGRSGGADHVLVKNHNLDEPSLALARAGAMRIIMTVRRVEDAMASWFDAFDAVPEAVALGVMHHWIGLFQQLRTKALIVPYEQIDRRPWVAVWRIARAICPIVYPTEVLAITRRLSKATVKRQTDMLPIEASGVTDPPRRRSLLLSSGASPRLAGGSGQEQQRQPDEVGQHISRSHQVCHPLAESCGNW
jgi:hypothetical protein